MDLLVDCIVAVQSRRLDGIIWMHQVRGMARRATWNTLLTVGVAALFTPVPGAWFSRGVGFHVFTEMVTAHEALIAHRAGEPFLAGVCAEVSLQLVGPGESFPTE